MDPGCIHRHYPQIAAMILLVFEDVGMPVFIISMIVIFRTDHRLRHPEESGQDQNVITLGMDEVKFDEKFPVTRIKGQMVIAY